MTYDARGGHGESGWGSQVGMNRGYLMSVSQKLLQLSTFVLMSQHGERGFKLGVG